MLIRVRLGFWYSFGTSASYQLDVPLSLAPKLVTQLFWNIAMVVKLVTARLYVVVLACTWSEVCNHRYFLIGTKVPTIGTLMGHRQRLYTMQF